MNDDSFIPSSRLTLRDVPSADAGRQEMEEFCQTIDGYGGGRYSIDDLMQQAERTERNGLEHASLDDLRSAAFIRQRQLRAIDGCSDEFEAPLVGKIRVLVGEIRRRLGASG